MNIGIDVRCLMEKTRTGVGEYTLGLLDALFKVDQENQFFLFYNSSREILDNLPKWDYENVHYVGTKWPNKVLNLLLFLRIVRLDKIVSHNTYHVSHNNRTIEQYNNIDIWFSPNLNFTNLYRGVKHIQTIHDLSFEFFPEFFTWKQRLWHWFLNPRRQCQKADIIITPSENTRRDVCEKYNVETHCNASVPKIIKLMPGLSSHITYHVTHNITEIDLLKKYNLPEKYILYLGTLEPRKNVETIIEAYKGLQTPPCPPLVGEGKGGVSLVLAGSPGWKSKQLMQLIKDTPGVKYLGYVNEAEKNALFKNASLFVFPSFYEGFGLPVLEAMAAGVPVISANRSSLPEVGQDAVYYVNPHNVSELVEGMELILKNTEISSIMVEKGLVVAQGFGWEKSAEELLTVINSLK